MSKPDLDAIQARADAATDGPWEVTKEATIIAPIQNADDAYWLFEAHSDHKDGRGIPVDDCIADAVFIAHARTDVPALLAYARDLEARVGRVEAAASRNALMDIIADAYGDKNHGHLSLAAADSIRAALTATEES